MIAADRGDRWYSGESVFESARRLGAAPAYPPNLTIPDDGLVAIPAALAAEVADEGNESGAQGALHSWIGPARCADVGVLSAQCRCLQAIRGLEAHAVSRVVLGSVLRDD